MNTRKAGGLGEETACDYLKKKGYRILDRNFFLCAQHGPKIAEIDIVAKKDGCFVFVEVKTGKYHPEARYLPQDRVDDRKLWKISKAAELWLVKNKVPYSVKWRIDVIAIRFMEDNRPKIIRWLFGPKCRIDHFENVFGR